METLAFQLLVTMQRNNTGVVSVSMELLRLRLPSNDGLQSNTSRYFAASRLTELRNSLWMLERVSNNVPNRTVTAATWGEHSVWTPVPRGNQLIGKMVSSGMLRLVALVRTDVSEEPGASFIRMTRISELGTTQAATSNRRTLRRFLQEPHGLTSQKTPFFIVTAVKTSNLTTNWKSWRIVHSSQDACAVIRKHSSRQVMVELYEVLPSRFYNLNLTVCV
jgi:hypothetical protein